MYDRYVPSCTEKLARIIVRYESSKSTSFSPKLDRAGTFDVTLSVLPEAQPPADVSFFLNPLVFFCLYLSWLINGLTCNGSVHNFTCVPTSMRVREFPVNRSIQSLFECRTSKTPFSNNVVTFPLYRSLIFFVLRHIIDPQHKSQFPPVSPLNIREG